MCAGPRQELKEVLRCSSYLPSTQTGGCHKNTPLTKPHLTVPPVYSMHAAQALGLGDGQN